MNAAKAKKNPTKFKGAVLIMILAVMTVLIILLAGSIAVVYSAHNRAYVKYTESQGYYTARSILDNFYEELNNDAAQQDSTGNSIGTYYKLDDETYSVLQPTPVQLSIQRAIELDTYKAIVDASDGHGHYYDWFVKYCDENKERLGSIINGFENTTADYTSASDGHNTALYGKVEEYLVNLNQAKLEDYGTYDKYYNQYFPVSTVDSKMQKNTIVYEIGSLDGFGSGTIDTNGDGSPDTFMQLGNLADSGVEKAWVTVEVKERILGMGEGTAYGERFRCAANHYNDHFVAKVTSHVIFNGEEMTTSLLWKNDTPSLDSPDFGMSNLGPLATTTSFTGIGNVATMDNSFLELTNNSTYAGDVYIEGSFDTGTATPYVMTRPATTFYVGETLKVNTNPPSDEVLSNGAVVYAKRAQLWSSGASFGTSSKNINLITKQFETHSETKEFYGNIFADKFDTTTNSTAVTQSFVASKTGVDGQYIFPNSQKKIHAEVYCNYLGVPADRVYLELDDSSQTAIFHLNYNSATGAPLPSGDAKRIENMIDSSSHINVLQGISIINGVEEEPVSGKNTLVNKYETYTYNGDTYTYFRDYDAAPSGVTDGTKFTVLGTGSAIRKNQEPTAGITYKVSIDWSNVDNSSPGGLIKHPYKTTTTPPTITSVKVDLMKYIDYDADISDDVWEFDDDYKKEFTLPSVGGTQLLLAGTNEDTYKIPTHRSLYGKYFFGSVTGAPSSTHFADTFNDDTGRFSMNPNDTTVYSFSFNDFLKDHVIPAEYYANNMYDPTVTPSATVAKADVDAVAMPMLTNEVVIGPGGGDNVNGIDMPSSSNVISSDGYIKSKNSDGSTYYIDARANKIRLQLGDGSGSQTFTGSFIVYGTKQVEIYVPGKTGGGNNQTIDIGTNGHRFMFMNEDLYSGESKDIIVLGEPIPPVPGKHSGTTTPAPKIKWYFSRNISEVKFHTGGGSEKDVTTLCGYIKAPYSFFNIDTNINGHQRETYYYSNRVKSTDNDRYTFIGSVLCNKYLGGQHAGICGIGSSSLPEDDGISRAYEPVFEYSIGY